MPALPWTAIRPAPVDGEIVVLASRLELPAYRLVPGFMRRAMGVHRATKTADGAIGAMLLAQPARKTFWTLSAWEDEAALRRFVGHPVHRAEMQHYRGKLRGATFTTWTVPAGTPLPPSWDEARARVAAADEARTTSMR
jgi:heme-degrading monooxygenase HmoA